MFQYIQLPSYKLKKLGVLSHVFYRFLMWANVVMFSASIAYQKIFLWGGLDVLHVVFL